MLDETIFTVTKCMTYGTKAYGKEVSANIQMFTVTELKHYNFTRVMQISLAAVQPSST